MSVYLDASVLVSLFVADAFSARAHNAFLAHPSVLIVSDFAAAEFASVIAREVRTRQFSHDEAREVFLDFDEWTERAATRVETLPADIRTAEAVLKRLDMTLRAPDAINIATAQRLGAELATFDARMTENARALGLSLAPV